MKTLSIIGAGNMGMAIARGLVKAGQFQKENIYLSTIDEAAAQAFKEEGFQTGSNQELAQASKLILLVVKPWHAEDVLKDLKDDISKEHIIASCVTGLTTETAFACLEQEIAFFRVMPNTGAMVGESMSCISDHNASEEQRQLIESIFSTLGLVLFIPADKMAAGTAIAGCGIAYVLRLIRAVTEAGVEIGIPAADAAKMAAQISKGAAELILQNESNPEVEIDKVTTPGGVTIAGLNALENNGYSSAIINGVKAAYNKAL